MRGQQVCACVHWFLLIAFVAGAAQHPVRAPDVHVAAVPSKPMLYNPAEADDTLDVRVTVTVDNSTKMSHDPHERWPVHVIIVLDTSGSMSGGPLQAAREGIGHVIDALGPRDEVTLISFNHRASTRMARSSAASAAEKARLKTVVQRLQAHGSTSISEGLDEATRHAVGSGAQMQTKILFFSDGEANTGDTTVAGILGRVRALSAKPSTSLSAFGVGAHFVESLVTQMAEVGKGQYYFVDPARHSTSLQQAMRLAFSGAVRQRGTEAVLKLVPRSGCQIVKAFGHTKDAVKHGIGMSDLVYGQHHTYYVRLSVPKTGDLPSMHVLDVKVTFTPSGTTETGRHWASTSLVLPVAKTAKEVVMATKPENIDVVNMLKLQAIAEQELNVVENIENDDSDQAEQEELLVLSSLDEMERDESCQQSMLCSRAVGIRKRRARTTLEALRSSPPQAAKKTASYSVLNNLYAADSMRDEL